MSDSLTLLQNRLVDGAFHIDASSLEGRYMYCPREYYYYALRRREVVRDTIGRDFGKFMHTILHEHYTREQDVLERADKRWAVAPVTTNPDEYRNLAYAHEVYRLYCETYGTNPVEEPFDVVRTEQAIAVPLPYAQFIWPTIWTGRVDLCVRMHATGKLWIMDHKTTSIGGETFWTQWVNSTQMHGYVWAVEQLVGEPVEGFIINALFVRKPTKTGKGIELVRQFFPISAEDKAETFNNWADNVTTHVCNIFTNVHYDQWPQNTNACVRKYGVCEYHDVCRFTKSRESLLDTALYRDVTWSPLNED